MERMVKYPELEGRIAARGIKKKVIAKHIGCSDKSLSNKLNGKSRFSWEEVEAMRCAFFPDVPSEVLMRTAE